MDLWKLPHSHYSLAHENLSFWNVPALPPTPNSDQLPSVKPQVLSGYLSCPLSSLSPIDACGLLGFPVAHTLSSTQLPAQCQAGGRSGMEWELSIAVGRFRMLLCPVTGHKALQSGEKCPFYSLGGRLRMGNGRQTWEWLVTTIGHVWRSETAVFSLLEAPKRDLNLSNRSPRPVSFFFYLLSLCSVGFLKPILTLPVVIRN